MGSCDPIRYNNIRTDLKSTDCIAIYIRMDTMDNSDVPRNPEHRREWIKYQLRLRGYTLKALGQELRVSRHAVKLALIKPYPRLEQAIAAKIGVPPHYIWPERYDAAGHPSRPKGRPRNA